MYTVLIVDDEPLIREGLRRLIDWEALGYTVIADMASAEEAMEPALALKPDLLITDVRLPGVSGISMIQALRQRGFQGEVFVISGYADFTYAKSAIRYGVKAYLIKPIDERELIGELYALKKTLARAAVKQNSHLSHSHQWSAFLHGQAELPQALQAGLAADGAPGSNLRIVLVTLWDGSQQPLPEGCVANALRASSAHGLKLLYTPMTQAVLLATLPASRLSRAIDGLFAALNRGEQRYGCVVGAPVERISDLPRSFESAQALWERRFLYAPDAPIWYSDAPACEDMLYEDASLLAEQVRKLLLYGSKDALHELLERWQNHFIAARSDEIVVKIAYSNFMQLILSRLASGYPDIKPELTDFQSMVKYIYLSSSIRELTEQAAERLCAIADALAATLPEAPMLKALDYIEHNYMNRLTVDSLAQALHYNSTYFGRKFKSYVGESFQSYLERVRLDKAKRLILEGYKVYEVATMVGFSSVDYFTEKFRQYAQLTPSQYRQQHMSGEP